MVEVFKTDVCDNKISKMIVSAIRNKFTTYKVNFDLEDCDHILRVETSRLVNPFEIIDIVADHGFTAEILEDVVNEPLDVISLVVT
jgi:hypothetical protein